MNSVHTPAQAITDTSSSPTEIEFVPGTRVTSGSWCRPSQQAWLAVERLPTGRSHRAAVQVVHLHTLLLVLSRRNWVSSCAAKTVTSSPCS
jgi:hypothetical protein